MKKLSALFLLWIFASVAVAESFPDDLYAMPLGDDLPDHKWSFKQGLDFDVVNFKNSKGSGVHMYLGVSENSAITTDSYVDAVFMGESTKLYKKCDAGESCMYSTTVKIGQYSNGRPVWTQIWIKPESKKEMSQYVNWLANLKFENRSS